MDHSVSHECDGASGRLLLFEDLLLLFSVCTRTQLSLMWSVQPAKQPMEANVLSWETKIGG